jgi:hypothetical protein
LELGSFFFSFFFLTDDLTLNDMTLILGVNMNASVSIETHVMYDKPFILKKKMIERPIYLKSEQNLRAIFLNLET